MNIFEKLIISEKKENPLFSVYGPLDVKLFTSLRLQFSHLNKHKFRHGFKDKINSLCACRAEVETTEYFLLNCQLYSTHRSELFDKIVKIGLNFLNLTAKDQVIALLCGSQGNNFENSNQNIINFAINYLKSTGRYLAVTNKICVFIVIIFVISYAFIGG